MQDSSLSHYAMSHRVARSMHGSTVSPCYTMPCDEWPRDRTVFAMPHITSWYAMLSHALLCFDMRHLCHAMPCNIIATVRRSDILRYDYEARQHILISFPDDIARTACIDLSLTKCHVFTGMSVVHRASIKLRIASQHSPAFRRLRLAVRRAGRNADPSTCVPSLAKRLRCSCAHGRTHTRAHT
jgi:hypothetical protein